MFHGAFRCHERGGVVGNPRRCAPPPGMRMTWVNGETGFVAVLDERVDRLVGQLRSRSRPFQ